MSVKLLLTVVLDGNVASAEAIVDAALEAAGVGKLDRRGSRIGGRTNPRSSWISHWLIADDPDAVRDTVEAYLRERGVTVLDVSASNVEPLERQQVNAAGVTFDITSGTLTIETSGDDVTDLSIALLHRPQSINGHIASTLGGVRVEDVLPNIRRIIVRRRVGQ